MCAEAGRRQFSSHEPKIRPRLAEFGRRQIPEVSTGTAMCSYSRLAMGRITGEFTSVASQR
jgi:hypothetical protein